MAELMVWNTDACSAIFCHYIFCQSHCARVNNGHWLVIDLNQLEGNLGNLLHITSHHIQVCHKGYEALAV